MIVSNQILQSIFVVLMSFICAQQASAFNIELNDLWYSLDDDNRSAKVLKGMSDPTDIVIPPEIRYDKNTYTVIGIQDRAFKDCRDLAHITIPNSVTEIGDEAFFGCVNLTCVTIPNSITEIKRGTFTGCQSLTSITIPNSVTTLGEEAFSYCSDLNSITIPNSVTEIKRDAFNRCRSLTNVTLPNSITTINAGLFYGCESLTNITIPNSVTSIGAYAFTVCGSLANITLPNSIKKIGNDAFLGCESLTSIEVPNSVTSIGSSAFNCCYKLTEVVLPSTIEKIEAEIFKDCVCLTNINIPNSVLSIGDAAFENCTALVSITIPDSVVSIGSSAFYGCTRLSEVTISSSVKEVGQNAFSNCERLETVHRPNTLELTDWAFSRTPVFREKARKIIASGDATNFYLDPTLAKNFAVGTWKMKGNNYVITITVKEDGTFTGTATQNDNYSRYAPYTGRTNKFINKVSGTIKGKWRVWDFLGNCIQFFVSSTNVTSAYSTINGHRVNTADAISTWEVFVHDRLSDFSYRPGNEAGHNQTLGNGFVYNDYNGTWHDRGIGPVYFYRVSTNKGRTRSKKR